MWLYHLYRVAAFLASRLPPWLGFRMADVMGTVTFLVNSGARGRADANLRHVLGPGASPAQRRRVALHAFRTSARNYYDLFRLPSITNFGRQVPVQVVGWDNLVEALEAGRGAIVVAPHMGSFDLMTRVAGERSVRLTIPVEHVEPERLFRFMVDMRSGHGVSMVAADNGALRTMYQALRRNEVVVIAADRDVMGNGAPVRFFDAPTTLPDAPAVISLRTGAPILVGYTMQQGDDSYYMEIGPVVPAPEVADPRQSARRLTDAVTARIENIIRLHPDQWVVFEPVWRELAHADEPEDRRN